MTTEQTKFPNEVELSAQKLHAELEAMPFVEGYIRHRKKSKLKQENRFANKLRKHFAKKHRDTP